MNKTFKVIFSKARNALMVVNEATGSVQAKGTKTVIATAIATALMVSGSAMAVTTQGDGAAAVSFDGQQLIKAENTEATLNVDFKDGVITVNELSGWSTPEGKTGQGALNNLSFGINDEVASVAMIVQGGETGGVISGNQSNNRGGAMTIYQNQATEQLKHQISGITFEKNTASVAGGAIAFGKWGIEGSTKVAAQLTNNKFNENSAQNGGAAYLENAEVTFTDSSFTDNSATEFGGAIYVDQSSSVVVDNIEFTDNSVESEDKGNGGAIFSLNGNVQVNESIFTENSSKRNGGAIAIASDNVRDDSVQQLSISNSEFVSNTAEKKGGAVFWYDYETNDRKGDLAIEQTTFKDNKANMGGAIYAENAFTVTGSQFTKNQATDDGGAIYAYTTADFAISNSVFQENTSSDNGGAIAAWADNGQDQNYSVTNSQFTENEATDKGGAISWLEYESIHDGASHVLSVEGSTFNSNTAQWGGAINTEGEITLRGETNFVGNTASQQGGAIFVSETGTLNVEGTAVFANNTANNTLNDIHNEGTVNVAGSLTLDGGISGDGTTNFGEKSSLNVHVGFNQNDSTTISNDVVIADGASLGFVFAPGYTGKYELFTGDIEGEFILTDDNTVFDVSLNEDGSYQVSQKSTDAITESTGANVNQSRAIRAILSDYSGSNEMFNNIAESVALGIQSSNASDRQAALDAVTALSTEAAPVIAQTQTDTATQVYAAVGSRFELTNTQEPGSNLWVQGLFSTGDYDDNGTAKGYDTDSNGIAFGLDSAVTDSVKVGVGFAYTDTDIDGFLRDTDVETKTAFIYGQYKPSNWYVNGIMSYGWSSYDESKHVAGFNVGADYDVETFGLQAMTGYDFEVAGINVTPEAGLRYFRISQDGYTDAAGSTVGSEDNDVLTAVVGAKVNKAWEVSPSVVIKPQARLAMTYDLVDADNNSVITLANGATYRVEGETMDRFGVEVDVGVAAEVTDNFEFALTYSGNFRGDFQNHAGLINAKYKF